MALFPCPECNKQISDKALACTNCGAPVLVKKELSKMTLPEKINTLFSRYIYIITLLTLVFLILKTLI